MQAIDSSVLNSDTSWFLSHSLLFRTIGTGKHRFCFSGLLSATDPVAVVALLKDLGASKKLSTIIEGESLMNDGYDTVTLEMFIF